MCDKKMKLTKKKREMVGQPISEREVRAGLSEE